MNILPDNIDKERLQIAYNQQRYEELIRSVINPGANNSYTFERLNNCLFQR